VSRCERRLCVRNEGAFALGAGNNGRVTVLSEHRLVAAGRAWWARSLYGHGYRRVRELDLDTHALALCAQQVLCTAPLVVAMSAVLQRTTGRGAGYFMTRFFGLYGDSANDVDRLFGRTAPSISTAALIFAMVTALLFTTSVAAVQQRAFELIWTLPRVIGIRSYVRQVAWAVLLGAYTGVMLLLGRLGRELDEDVGRPAFLCIIVVQGVLTFLFYWWSQYWLLGGRVTWRALRAGAIAVGIGTTVLFRLTRVVMPGQIGWQVHAYGLIGGVFVLSVWLMILSVVIFGGVLVGALLTEKRAAAADAGDAGRSPLTLEGLASAAGSADDIAEDRPNRVSEQLPAG
jgi:membrane protein